MINREKTCFLISLVAAVVMMAAIFTPPTRASAQASFSVMDLINAVNALRASRGLAPYQVDGELMAYAQRHADFQASINMATHQHNDNSTAWQSGMEENIATGTTASLTVEFVVSQIWADAIHMKTMVDYTSGFIGAGLAVSGGEIYISLNVRPGNRAAPQATAVPPGMNVPTQAAASTATPFIPLVALVTVTPRADGAVIHKVGYGQTLWDIAKAYNVKLADLRALNSMATDSNDIFANQRLLVKLHAPTPLPPTATGTNIVQTQNTIETQDVASVPITPAGARETEDVASVPITPTAEETQDVASLQPPAAVQAGSFLPDKKTIAFILIGVCTLGLAAVAASSFRK